MQGSSGDSKENIDKRISEDAAKTLQNVLNSVRVSLEDEFAIQQMEYDELYGVGSEEFERYQVQVGQWLKENRLVDSVVDMLPLTVFMNRRQVTEPKESPWSGPVSAAQVQQAQSQSQFGQEVESEPSPQPPALTIPSQTSPAPAETPLNASAPSAGYDAQSASYASLEPPPNSAPPTPPMSAFAPPPSSPTQPDYSQSVSPGNLTQNIAQTSGQTEQVPQFPIAAQWQYQEESAPDFQPVAQSQSQTNQDSPPAAQWQAASNSAAPMAWTQASAMESVQEAQDGFESGGW
ncbi:MAG: hypothetical protein K8F91_10635, partial [Candidatus Obscuribacterales bacterium]|nr:hypothetical protein [Candidatus Obscuribacterales bacterium]